MSTKSRPGSANPIQARPSSAGATRTRGGSHQSFANRGSVGVTNLYAQSQQQYGHHHHPTATAAVAANGIPYGLYGESVGTGSAGSGRSSGQSPVPHTQHHTQPAPPLSLSGGGVPSSTTAPTASSNPARPRSAGAVRRPADNSNVVYSTGHSGAAAGAYALPSAGYEQNYQSYALGLHNLHTMNTTPAINAVPGQASPLALHHPQTISQPQPQQRPLSASATHSQPNGLFEANQWNNTAYKLQYGQNTAAATAGLPVQQQQTQGMNNPYGAMPQQQQQQQQQRGNSSAATKLRQALDLSSRLSGDGKTVGAVPIGQLIGSHQQPAAAAPVAATAAGMPVQGGAVAGGGEDDKEEADDGLILGVEGEDLETRNQLLQSAEDEEMDGKPIAMSSSAHPEVSMSATTPSMSIDFAHSTVEIRNTSVDSFADEHINIGLSTVPNQFCTKRDGLELKKLLLLSAGTRGGIVPSSSAVMDMYMVGKVVGVGSYGKVRAAWHRLTGNKVAIKTYDKSKLKDPAHWKRVHSEIKIMEQISHPRIARMYEAVETPKRMHLIMECLDGGNLCSYVKAKRRLSEDESRRIFFQILQAIEHLHSLGVSHRDVKLENVLFVNDRDIKLIDFGFSTVCQPGKKLKVFCGTPSYMAPEIVRRVEYEGRPVDVWSLGILLYALLCGCFPFRAKAYPDLYRRIARGTFAIPDELSSPVKDLLRQLLTVDVEQRVTAHTALRHSWLQVQLVNAPNIDKMRQEMTVLISDKPADDLDEQVLSELTVFGMSRDEIVRLVLSKTHCSLTTLYYLLLENVIAKRRQAGNKRAGPSGMGNFAINGAAQGSGGGVLPVSGAPIRSQSRPKSATGLGHSTAYNLATSFANGMIINQQAAPTMQMYMPMNVPIVPSNTNHMMSPYDVLMHQQQQTEQQDRQEARYRPKSASAARGSGSAQRPLSAYAGRR